MQTAASVSSGNPQARPVSGLWHLTAGTPESERLADEAQCLVQTQPATACFVGQQLTRPYGLPPFVKQFPAATNHRMTPVEQWPQKPPTQPQSR